jgi:protein-S-isoprenylcysteine O-methyltransferase Ste14
MNTLAVKAFAGFLNLFVILSLCLFLPAWTFDFWQAWLFLASFFGPVLIITLYLLKRDPSLLQRRIKVGPISEHRTNQKVIQTVASISFILIVLIPGIDHRLHWSVVPAALAIIADVAIILGLSTVFLVFKENTFTSATIELAENQRVISTGPYAVVRHPMYLGALVFLGCVPIALNSWWALLAVPPLVAAIIFRLLDEERLLVDSLAGYSDYCREVQWRLLPHIW